MTQTTTEHPAADLRWVRGLLVQRSPIHPDTWVPCEPFDSPPDVARHAGPLDVVQAWAEQYTTDLSAAENIPITHHRWERTSDAELVLWIVEGPKHRDP